MVAGALPAVITSGEEKYRVSLPEGWANLVRLVRAARTASSNEEGAWKKQESDGGTKEKKKKRKSGERREEERGTMRGITQITENVERMNEANEEKRAKLVEREGGGGEEGGCAGSLGWGGRLACPGASSFWLPVACMLRIHLYQPGRTNSRLVEVRLRWLCTMIAREPCCL